MNSNYSVKNKWPSEMSSLKKKNIYLKKALLMIRSSSIFKVKTLLHFNMSYPMHLCARIKQQEKKPFLNVENHRFSTVFSFAKNKCFSTYDKMNIIPYEKLCFSTLLKKKRIFGTLKNLLRREVLPFSKLRFQHVVSKANKISKESNVELYRRLMEYGKFIKKIKNDFSSAKNIDAKKIIVFVFRKAKNGRKSMIFDIKKDPMYSAKMKTVENQRFSTICKSMIFNITQVSKNRENSEIYWNYSFDKGRIKTFVFWFLQNYGEKHTVQLLEQLKNIGFDYATKAGISLGIDDLKIPTEKTTLIVQAEQLTHDTINQYKRGDITGVERFQKLIDTWHRTSEILKQEVIENFESTDVLNPVYMMAFSGARGNISQVRQLVGMRGLMADPQGKILDFPIRSNFREGLTLTEYIISSYGARKGIVDTALRTANAGYLTRRLVDVAQHVVISHFDCGTHRGVFVNEMKEGNKTIYSLQNRLLGRVLAKNIYSGGIQIAWRNQEISSEIAMKIAKVTKKVFIRSPLTCETRKLVCQLCYGWSLSQGKLVSIGEAVGTIAAQSIGEPGTQLTMRTFHTGGVFTGDITEQINAPYDGIVKYITAIPGTLIRTPQGIIAFLTKTEGTLIVKESSDVSRTNMSAQRTNIKKDISDKKQTQNFSLFSSFKSSLQQQITAKEKAENKNQIYKIPPYTILYIRNGESVLKEQIIAQSSTISQQKKQRNDAEQKISSEIEGEIYTGHLDLIETTNDFEDTSFEAWDWGYLWILSGKIYQLPISSKLFPNAKDIINKNSAINQIKWISSNECFLEIKTMFSAKLKSFSDENQRFSTLPTVENQRFSTVFSFAENISIRSSSPFKLSKIKDFRPFSASLKTFSSLIKKVSTIRNEKDNIIFNGSKSFLDKCRKQSFRQSSASRRHGFDLFNSVQKFNSFLKLNKEQSSIAQKKENLSKLSLSKKALHKKVQSTNVFSRAEIIYGDLKCKSIIFDQCTHLQAQNNITNAPFYTNLLNLSVPFLFPLFKLQKGVGKPSYVESKVLMFSAKLKTVENHRFSTLDDLLQVEDFLNLKNEKRSNLFYMSKIKDFRLKMISASLKTFSYYMNVDNPSIIKKLAMFSAKLKRVENPIKFKMFSTSCNVDLLLLNKIKNECHFKIRQSYSVNPKGFQCTPTGAQINKGMPHFINALSNFNNVNPCKRKLTLASQSLPGITKNNKEQHIENHRFSAVFSSAENIFKYVGAEHQQDMSYLSNVETSLIKLFFDRRIFDKTVDICKGKTCIFSNRMKTFPIKKKKNTFILYSTLMLVDWQSHNVFNKAEIISRRKSPKIQDVFDMSSKTKNLTRDVENQRFSTVFSFAENNVEKQSFSNKSSVLKNLQTFLIYKILNFYGRKNQKYIKLFSAKLKSFSDKNPLKFKMFSTLKKKKEQAHVDLLLLNKRVRMHTLEKSAEHPLAHFLKFKKLVSLNGELSDCLPTEEFLWIRSRHHIKKELSSFLIKHDNTGPNQYVNTKLVNYFKFMYVYAQICHVNFITTLTFTYCFDICKENVEKPKNSRGFSTVFSFAENMEFFLISQSKKFVKMISEDHIFDRMSFLQIQKELNFRYSTIVSIKAKNFSNKKAPEYPKKDISCSLNANAYIGNVFSIAEDSQKASLFDMSTNLCVSSIIKNVKNLHYRHSLALNYDHVSQNSKAVNFFIKSLFTDFVFSEAENGRKSSRIFRLFDNFNNSQCIYLYTPTNKSLMDTSHSIVLAIKFPRMSKIYDFRPFSASLKTKTTALCCPASKEKFQKNEKKKTVENPLKCKMFSTLSSASRRQSKALLSTINKSNAFYNKKGNIKKFRLFPIALYRKKWTVSYIFQQYKLKGSSENFLKIKNQSDMRTSKIRDFRPFSASLKTLWVKPAISEEFYKKIIKNIKSQFNVFSKAENGRKSEIFDIKVGKGLCMILYNKKNNSYNVFSEAENGRKSLIFDMFLNSQINLFTFIMKSIAFHHKGSVPYNVFSFAEDSRKAKLFDIFKAKQIKKDFSNVNVFSEAENGRKSMIFDTSKTSNLMEYRLGNNKLSHSANLVKIKQKKKLPCLHLNIDEDSRKQSFRHLYKKTRKMDPSQNMAGNKLLKNDDLILKKPILFFKIEKIRYKKLGYFFDSKALTISNSFKKEHIVEKPKNSRGFSTVFSEAENIYKKNKPLVDHLLLNKGMRKHALQKWHNFSLKEDICYAGDKELEQKDSTYNVFSRDLFLTTLLPFCFSLIYMLKVFPCRFVQAFLKKSYKWRLFWLTCKFSKIQKNFVENQRFSTVFSKAENVFCKQKTVESFAFDNYFFFNVENQRFLGMSQTRDFRLFSALLNTNDISSAENRANVFCKQKTVESFAFDNSKNLKTYKKKYTSGYSAHKCRKQSFPFRGSYESRRHGSQLSMCLAKLNTVKCYRRTRFNKNYKVFSEAKHFNPKSFLDKYGFDMTYLNVMSSTVFFSFFDEDNFSVISVQQNVFSEAENGRKSLIFDKRANMFFQKTNQLFFSIVKTPVMSKSLKIQDDFRPFSASLKTFIFIPEEFVVRSFEEYFSIINLLKFKRRPLGCDTLFHWKEKCQKNFNPLIVFSEAEIIVSSEAENSRKSKIFDNHPKSLISQIFPYKFVFSKAKNGRKSSRIFRLFDKKAEIKNDQLDKYGFDLCASRHRRISSRFKNVFIKKEISSGCSAPTNLKICQKSSKIQNVFDSFKRSLKHGDLIFKFVGTQVDLSMRKHALEKCKSYLIKTGLFDLWEQSFKTDRQFRPAPTVDESRHYRKKKNHLSTHQRRIITRIKKEDSFSFLIRPVLIRNVENHRFSALLKTNDFSSAENINEHLFCALHIYVKSPMSSASRRQSKALLSTNSKKYTGASQYIYQKEKHTCKSKCPWTLWRTNVENQRFSTVFSEAENKHISEKDKQIQSQKMSKIKDFRPFSASLKTYTSFMCFAPTNLKISKSVTFRTSLFCDILCDTNLKHPLEQKDSFFVYVSLDMERQRHVYNVFDFFNKEVKHHDKSFFNSRNQKTPLIKKISGITRDSRQKTADNNFFNNTYNWNFSSNCFMQWFPFRYQTYLPGICNIEYIQNPDINMQLLNLKPFTKIYKKITNFSLKLEQYFKFFNSLSSFFLSNKKVENLRFSKVSTYNTSSHTHLPFLNLRSHLQSMHAHAFVKSVNPTGSSEPHGFTDQTKASQSLPVQAKACTELQRITKNNLTKSSAFRQLLSISLFSASLKSFSDENPLKFKMFSTLKNVLLSSLIKSSLIKSHILLKSISFLIRDVSKPYLSKKTLHLIRSFLIRDVPHMKLAGNTNVFPYKFKKAEINPMKVTYMKVSLFKNDTYKKVQNINLNDFSSVISGAEIIMRRKSCKIQDVFDIKEGLFVFSEAENGRKSMIFDNEKIFPFFKIKSIIYNKKQLKWKNCHLFSSFDPKMHEFFNFSKSKNVENQKFVLSSEDRRASKMKALLSTFNDSSSARDNLNLFHLNSFAWRDFQRKANQNVLKCFTVSNVYAHCYSVDARHPLVRGIKKPSNLSVGKQITLLPGKKNKLSLEMKSSDYRRASKMKALLSTYMKPYDVISDVKLIKNDKLKINKKMSSASRKSSKMKALLSTYKKSKKKIDYFDSQNLDKLQDDSTVVLSSRFVSFAKKGYVEKPKNSRGFSTVFSFAKNISNHLFYSSPLTKKYKKNVNKKEIIDVENQRFSTVFSSAENNVFSEAENGRKSKIFDVFPYKFKKAKIIFRRKSSKIQDVFDIFPFKFKKAAIIPIHAYAYTEQQSRKSYLCRKQSFHFRCFSVNSRLVKIRKSFHKKKQKRLYFYNREMFDFLIFSNAGKKLPTCLHLNIDEDSRKQSFRHYEKSSFLAKQARHDYTFNSKSALAVNIKKTKHVNTVLFFYKEKKYQQTVLLIPQKKTFKKNFFNLISKITSKTFYQNCRSIKRVNAEKQLLPLSSNNIKSSQGLYLCGRILWLPQELFTIKTIEGLDLSSSLDALRFNVFSEAENGRKSSRIFRLFDNMKMIDLNSSGGENVFSEAENSRKSLIFDNVFCKQKTVESFAFDRYSTNLKMSKIRDFRPFSAKLKTRSPFRSVHARACIGMISFFKNTKIISLSSASRRQSKALLSTLEKSSHDMSLSYLKAKLLKNKMFFLNKCFSTIRESKEKQGLYKKVLLKLKILHKTLFKNLNLHIKKEKNGNQNSAKDNVFSEAENGRKSLLDKYGFDIIINSKNQQVENSSVIKKAQNRFLIKNDKIILHEDLSNSKSEDIIFKFFDFSTLNKTSMFGFSHQKSHIKKEKMNTSLYYWIGKNNLLFYLTNRQGVKQPYYTKSEGFVQIKRNLPKNINTLSSLNLINSHSQIDTNLKKTFQQSKNSLKFKQLLTFLQPLEIDSLFDVHFRKKKRHFNNLNPSHKKEKFYLNQFKNKLKNFLYVEKPLSSASRRQSKALHINMKLFFNDFSNKKGVFSAKLKSFSDENPRFSTFKKIMSNDKHSFSTIQNNFTFDLKKKKTCFFVFKSNLFVLRLFYKNLLKTEKKCFTKFSSTQCLHLNIDEDCRKQSFRHYKKHDFLNHLNTVTKIYLYKEINSLLDPISCALFYRYLKQTPLSYNMKPSLSKKALIVEKPKNSRGFSTVFSFAENKDVTHIKLGQNKYNMQRFTHENDICKSSKIQELFDKSEVFGFFYIGNKLLLNKKKEIKHVFSSAEEHFFVPEEDKFKNKISFSYFKKLILFRCFQRSLKIKIFNFLKKKWKTFVFVFSGAENGRKSFLDKYGFDMTLPDKIKNDDMFSAKLKSFSDENQRFSTFKENKDFSYYKSNKKDTKDVNFHPNDFLNLYSKKYSEKSSFLDSSFSVGAVIKHKPLSILANNEQLPMSSLNVFSEAENGRKSSRIFRLFDMPSVLFTPTKYIMQIKQGWMYLTSDINQILKYHKTFVPSGKNFVDDILFDKNMVYIECISIKNNQCMLSHANACRSMPMHAFACENASASQSLHGITKNNKELHRIGNTFVSNRSLPLFILQKTKKWLFNSKIKFLPTQLMPCSNLYYEKLSFSDIPMRKYTLKKGLPQNTYEFFNKLALIKYVNKFKKDKFHFFTTKDFNTKKEIFVFSEAENGRKSLIFDNKTEYPHKIYLIIIRKVNEYSILNKNEHKKHLYLETPKQPNIPFFFRNLRKNYHSSLLNKQSVTKKVITKFPNIDIQINYSTSFSLINKFCSIFSQNLKKQGNSKNVENQRFSTKENDKLLQSSLVQQRSIKKFFLYNEYQQKNFYSSKPINFLPFLVSFSNSSDFDVPFKAPLIRFNFIKNINFNTLQLNNSKEFCYIISLLLNQCPLWRAQKNKLTPCGHGFSSTVDESRHLSIFIEFLPFLFSLPCFEFSLIQLFSYLVNQKIFAKQFLENNLNVFRMRKTFLIRETEQKISASNNSISVKKELPSCARFSVNKRTYYKNNILKSKNILSKSLKIQDDFRPFSASLKTMSSAMLKTVEKQSFSTAPNVFSEAENGRKSSRIFRLFDNNKWGSKTHKYGFLNRASLLYTQSMQRQNFVFPYKFKKAEIIFRRKSFLDKYGLDNDQKAFLNVFSEAENGRKSSRIFRLFDKYDFDTSLIKKDKLFRNVFNISNSFKKDLIISNNKNQSKAPVHATHAIVKSVNPTGSSEPYGYTDQTKASQSLHGITKNKHVDHLLLNKDMRMHTLEKYYGKNLSNVENQRFSTVFSFAENKESLKLHTFKSDKTSTEKQEYFPQLKNHFISNNKNQILKNNCFGYTSFMSPLNGEILSSKSHYWTSVSQKNRHFILTHSDLISFSLPLDYKKIRHNMSSQGLLQAEDSRKQSFRHLIHLKKSISNVKEEKPFLLSSLIKKVSTNVESKAFILDALLPAEDNTFVNDTSFLATLKKPNTSKIKDRQSSELLKTSTLTPRRLKSTLNKKRRQHQLVKNADFKGGWRPVIIKHNKKIYKISGLNMGFPDQKNNLCLGEFCLYGDSMTPSLIIPQAGQIIHTNQFKITLRKGQPIFVSPKGILHAYNGDFIKKNISVVTLPYQTLKTGDIVQGIPKIEQYFEARTTKRGRLFRDNLPNLLKGLFQRYKSILPWDKAVRQSFYKIQQILVDGVQRVYRSQGVSIADKHIEVIVKQMTTKVKITHGGQTGFFPGELIDLEFIEHINQFLMKKIRYEPVILGITKASLEVESFLSAASFQQTTRMLSRAAIQKRKDFLKGLKENVIVGNLIPAGTGYLVTLEDMNIRSDSSTIKSIS